MLKSHAVKAIRHSVFVLCMLCLFLFACEGEEKTPASSAQPAQQEPLVGLLLYRHDDAYIRLVGEHITSALKDRVVLETRAAGYDQLTQNEQIDTLIAQGAKALMINLVESQAAAHVLDKVKRAGIPAVFFNREPDLVMLESYKDKACFVGTNVADAGKLQGDIIARLWEKHPEYDRNHDGMIQFVMFQGDPDNPEAVARTEYSVKQAVEKGVAMSQLGQTYLCAWDEKLATQAMALAWAEFGDAIELVIANNDAMALGTIHALNQVGYNEPGNKERFIPVVGVDALDAAVQAVKDGRMSATVVQDAKAMADAVAALVLNSLSGKAFLDGTAYEWDNNTPAVRIPYAPFGGE